MKVFGEGSKILSERSEKPVDILQVKHGISENIQINSQNIEHFAKIREKFRYFLNFSKKNRTKDSKITRVAGQKQTRSQKKQIF